MFICMSMLRLKHKFLFSCQCYYFWQRNLLPITGLILQDSKLPSSVMTALIHLRSVHIHQTMPLTVVNCWTTNIWGCRPQIWFAVSQWISSKGRVHPIAPISRLYKDFSVYVLWFTEITLWMISEGSIKQQTASLWAEAKERPQVMQRLALYTDGWFWKTLTANWRRPLLVCVSFKSLSTEPVRVVSRLV